MSVTDHIAVASPGRRPAGPGPGRTARSAVDVRLTEAPVASMAGGSGGTTLTTEAVADTRPWIALEYA